MDPLSSLSSTALAAPIRDYRVNNLLTWIGDYVESPDLQRQMDALIACVANLQDLCAPGTEKVAELQPFRRLGMAFMMDLCHDLECSLGEISRVCNKKKEIRPRTFSREWNAEIASPAFEALAKAIEDHLLCAQDIVDILHGNDRATADVQTPPFEKSGFMQRVHSGSDMVVAEGSPGDSQRGVLQNLPDLSASSLRKNVGNTLAQPLPRSRQTIESLFNFRPPRALQKASDRTRLTQEQITILEQEFEKLPKPSTDFKKHLADSIDLALARVNSWYQNRRAKMKNVALAEPRPGFIDIVGDPKPLESTFGDSESRSLVSPTIAKLHDASDVDSSLHRSKKPTSKAISPDRESTIIHDRGGIVDPKWGSTTSSSTDGGKPDTENARKETNLISFAAQTDSRILADEEVKSEPISITDDEDDICDFLVLLDRNKGLKSFKIVKNQSSIDTSKQQINAALSRFQQLRSSYAALAESISSSLLHCSSPAIMNPLTHIWDAKVKEGDLDYDHGIPRIETLEGKSHLASRGWASVTEHVSSLEDAGKESERPSVRWTKTERNIIGPQALIMSNEQYEDRSDHVVASGPSPQEVIPRDLFKRRQIETIGSDLSPDFLVNGSSDKMADLEQRELLFKSVISAHQKKANTVEALLAREQEQTEIAAYQSRLVMMFTVFTVLFLPLSFFASFNGMNAKELDNVNQDLRLRSVLICMGSISIVVVVVSLLIAFDHFKRRTLHRVWQIFANSAHKWYKKLVGGSDRVVVGFIRRYIRTKYHENARNGDNATQSVRESPALMTEISKLKQVMAGKENGILNVAQCQIARLFVIIFVTVLQISAFDASQSRIGDWPSPNEWSYSCGMSVLAGACVPSIWIYSYQKLRSFFFQDYKLFQTAEGTQTDLQKSDLWWSFGFVIVLSIISRPGLIILFTQGWDHPPRVLGWYMTQILSWYGPIFGYLLLLELNNQEARGKRFPIGALKQASFQLDSFRTNCHTILTAFTLLLSRIYFQRAIASPSHKRILNKCRCGYQFFDDFIEVRPAAATKYEASLMRRLHGGKTTTYADTPRSKVESVDEDGKSPRSSSSLSLNLIGINGLVEVAKGFFRKKSINPSLPQYQVHAQDPKAPKISARNEELLFLLLCIPYHKYATKLLQPQVSEIRSDQDFFLLLRRNYLQMRGRTRRLFSLKALSGIKFVQLEMYKSELVDIRKHNDLPPEDKKDEYRYHPVPAEIIPPVGENHMLHLMSHPSHAEEDGFVLDRIPKKLKEKLLVCPSRGTGLGWGIHFIEGWCVGLITLIAFAILILGSLAFLICWSVLEHDLQGASGVAAYVVAFLGLAIGSVQAVFELT